MDFISSDQRLVDVRFLGTGSALPAREISNGDFLPLITTVDNWIVQRTGIQSRRYCAETESSATLAIEASRRAMADARIEASGIDLVVCATVTPERATPPNAAQVQAALGCGSGPAFDIASACSGFMFALGVARAMILSGAATNALVIGAEALSRALDFRDRNSCVLFGDGAGAIVLARTDEPGRGVLYFTMETDGVRGDLIQVPAIGPSRNGLATVCSRNPAYIGLEGPRTFRFAVDTMTTLLDRVRAMCGFRWDEIAAIIPHQVNVRVFESVASHLGISLDRMVCNIDRLGNTAAASVPMALDEARRAGRIQSGDLFVLVAFGGGLSWSASLIRW